MAEILTGEEEFRNYQKLILERLDLYMKAGMPEVL